MTLEQLSICATFFGALTALVIFNQWRKQKGSEVIANEAKLVIYNVRKLSKYYNKNNYKFNRDTIKVVAKDGICLIEDLIENIDFIYKSIDNRKDKLTIISFNRILNLNYWSYKTILDLNKSDTEIKEILKEINSKYSDKAIIRLMLNYSLYKKNINLKEDKSA